MHQQPAKGARSHAEHSASRLINQRSDRALCVQNVQSGGSMYFESPRKLEEKCVLKHALTEA